jgi:hypothetical protein
VTLEEALVIGKQLADAITFSPGYIPPQRLIADRLVEIVNSTVAFAVKQERETCALIAEKFDSKEIANAIRR